MTNCGGGGVTINKDAVVFGVAECAVAVEPEVRDCDGVGVDPGKREGWCGVEEKDFRAEYGGKHWTVDLVLEGG